MTDKQQRFVDEYMVDLNATQAAIRAGYSPKKRRAGRLSATSENFSFERNLKTQGEAVKRVVNWTAVDVLKRLVTLANEYLHTLTSTTQVRTRDDTGECIGNEVMASNIMEVP